MTKKQKQWQILLKNPVDSGKIFFEITVNTGPIDIGFEANTCSTYGTFRQRSGDKVIDKQQKNLVACQ